LKAKLEARRKKGLPLGNAIPGKIAAMRRRYGKNCFQRFGEHAGKASGRARRAQCDEHYSKLLPVIEGLLKEERPYPEICDRLNQAGHRTVQGKPFQPSTLCRLLQRMKK
jgi:hypothetical protein